jgi:hypothetical protein
MKSTPYQFNNIHPNCAVHTYTHLDGYRPLHEKIVYLSVHAWKNKRQYSLCTSVIQVPLYVPVIPLVPVLYKYTQVQPLFQCGTIVTN